MKNYSALHKIPIKLKASIRLKSKTLNLLLCFKDHIENAKNGEKDAYTIMLIQRKVECKAKTTTGEIEALSH